MSASFHLHTKELFPLEKDRCSHICKYTGDLNERQERDTSMHCSHLWLFDDDLILLHQESKYFPLLLCFPREL